MSVRNPRNTYDVRIPRKLVTCSCAPQLWFTFCFKKGLFQRRMCAYPLMLRFINIELSQTYGMPSTCCLNLMDIGRSISVHSWLFTNISVQDLKDSHRITHTVENLHAHVLIK